MRLRTLMQPYRAEKVINELGSTLKGEDASSASFVTRANSSLRACKPCRVVLEKLSLSESSLVRMTSKKPFNRTNFKRSKWRYRRRVSMRTITSPTPDDDESLSQGHQLKECSVLLERISPSKLSLIENSCGRRDLSRSSSPVEYSTTLAPMSIIHPSILKLVENNARISRARSSRSSSIKTYCELPDVDLDEVSSDSITSRSSKPGKKTYSRSGKIRSRDTLKRLSFNDEEVKSENICLNNSLSDFRICDVSVVLTPIDLDTLKSTDSTSNEMGFNSNNEYDMTVQIISDSPLKMKISRCRRVSNESPPDCRMRKNKTRSLFPKIKPIRISLSAPNPRLIKDKRKKRRKSLLRGYRLTPDAVEVMKNCFVLIERLRMPLQGGESLGNDQDSSHLLNSSSDVDHRGDEEMVEATEEMADELEPITDLSDLYDSPHSNNNCSLSNGNERLRLQQLKSNANINVLLNVIEKSSLCKIGDCLLNVGKNGSDSNTSVDGYKTAEFREETVVESTSESCSEISHNLNYSLDNDGKTFDLHRNDNMSEFIESCSNNKDENESYINHMDLIRCDLSLVEADTNQIDCISSDQQCNLNSMDINCFDSCPRKTDSIKVNNVSGNLSNHFSEDSNLNVDSRSDCLADLDKYLNMVNCSLLVSNMDSFASSQALPVKIPPMRP